MNVSKIDVIPHEKLKMCQTFLIACELYIGHKLILLLPGLLYTLERIFRSRDYFLLKKSYFYPLFSCNVYMYNQSQKWTRIYPLSAFFPTQNSSHMSFTYHSKVLVLHMFENHFIHKYTYTRVYQVMR